MIRSIRPLGGTWHFQLDPDETLSVTNLDPDREIPVPMPRQAAFPDLASYSGYAWYRTSFRGCRGRTGIKLAVEPERTVIVHQIYNRVTPNSSTR